MKKENKKLRFILNLLIRYLILLLLVLALPLLYRFLTDMTLFFSAEILKLFFNSVFINQMTIIINSGVLIEIIPACIAGSAYILLLILNLTTSMKIKKRILSILFSFLLLFIINILRISFLSILYYNNFLFFELTHRLTWYFLSTIFVVGIWFLTAKIFAIKEIPVYSDIVSVIKFIKN
ncbi:MAG: pacearchaeosortase [Candidatus Nanoarchaeia archaeon]|nr:pacearchaeosortase [Candidatus Nanoarchaeia archaeon]